MNNILETVRHAATAGLLGSTAAAFTGLWLNAALPPQGLTQDLHHTKLQHTTAQNDLRKLMLPPAPPAVVAYPTPVE